MYRKDEPSALFHILHQSHPRQVVKAQAEHGLAGLGSPMLLLTLFRGEREERQWSQRELAKAMGLAPATVAASLKTLERDGYVARAADDRDARRNRVTLTGKGREAVEACGRAFRSVDEQMLSGFSRQEREQLTGFFSRMLENLGGPPDYPPPPDCVPDLSQTPGKERP